MSIATLKRKTQSKYNNSSVGGPHFSLHGTHRNQGYIGQTSLSRSLPRTLAGGAYNKGHGGCCGTYTDLESPVVSAVSSTEDSAVIKSAVLSSKGMMAKRLRCCEPTVKPDNSTSLNSQSSYLEYLKNKCAKIESEVMPDPVNYNTCAKCNLTKTDTDINVAISQEEHLKNVKGKVLNCEDMAPEFHRKSNTCTTGRGACGSD